MGAIGTTSFTTKLQQTSPCPYTHHTLYFCLFFSLPEVVDLFSICFLKRGVGSGGPAGKKGPDSRGNSVFTFLNIFLRIIIYWEASVSAQRIQDEAFEQLKAIWARAGDSQSFF